MCGASGFIDVPNYTNKQKNKEKSTVLTVENYFIITHYVG